MALVNKETLIVGIDPGTHNFGIGCISKSGNNLRLITAQVIKAPAKETLYERLKVIAPQFYSLLDQLNPKEVALEDVFFAKNAKSAFQLGIVRGIVFAACLARDIKIFEYAPTQVKSTVTGYGRADKAQVQKMVGLLLGTELKTSFDASDAVAVAICHASINRILAKELQGTC
ncbi:MAG: crossover junction endodeoxyribonuclease RuvC [Bdellovibrionales bacterium]|nr:crossover junction endodeoxyribonuclease RuvC [Bdellovibrionales bacterium]